MKLLVYSTMSIIPTDHGGAVRIHNIIKKMSEKGIDVTLISPRPFTTNNELIDDNINYAFYNPTIPKMFDKIEQFDRIKQFLNFFVFLRELFAVKSIFSSVSAPGAIILQSEYIYSIIPLYIIKKLYNIPLVVTEHNVECEVSLEIEKNRIYYKILKFIETFFLNRCDQIFCVSARDKHTFSEKYGIPPNKIVIAPNATNIPIITPCLLNTIVSIKQKLGICSNEKIILFMGTLGYYPNKKAIDIIRTEINPRIRRHLNDVVFMIVGKGTDPKIEGNIIFTGSVEDVSPYIHMSDIAIAPLTEGGGTRLKILEYMAFSKPVVSTLKGAEGLEITNNENIIISDDWTDFSDVIIDLLQDKDLRARIGNNGRTLIEKKYTWDSTCNIYIETYSKILQSNFK